MKGQELRQGVLKMVRAQRADAVCGRQAGRLSLDYWWVSTPE